MMKLMDCSQLTSIPYQIAKQLIINVVKLGP